MHVGIAAAAAADVLFELNAQSCVGNKVSWITQLTCHIAFCELRGARVGACTAVSRKLEPSMPVSDQLDYVHLANVTDVVKTCSCLHLNPQDDPSIPHNSSLNIQFSQLTNLSS